MLPPRAARLGIGVIHQELEILDNLDVAGNVFLGREHTWCGPLRLIDRSGSIRSGGAPGTPRHAVVAGDPAEPTVHGTAAARCHRARAFDEGPAPHHGRADVEPHAERHRAAVSGDSRSAVSGVTIIYISHRLSEIEALADRVVVLRDGRNAGLLLRQRSITTRWYG